MIDLVPQLIYGGEVGVNIYNRYILSVISTKTEALEFVLICNLNFKWRCEYSWILYIIKRSYLDIEIAV